jgi:ATP-dependent DNA ligase
MPRPDGARPADGDIGESTMATRFAPVGPPLAPMLARLVEAIPDDPAFLFEPKWDGFRAIVFRRGDALLIQSRDERPLDRYFPELHDALLARLPPRCVVDGEIVIATPTGLDFDALQLRIHPAASRVAALAEATPASFVAFDLLAIGGRDWRARPMSERRAELERALGGARAPLHVTPMTRDPAVARRWFAQFEGAGLDGVVAKPAAAPYQPGKRVMLKIKHQRTADCVVGGFRWHRADRRAIGSLLLGLYDDSGTLRHVGVTSSFTMATRRALVDELLPLRTRTAPFTVGGVSRWSAGRDLSWVPLRPERVCEVKYDHLQGRRFRHATIFLRWRPDKRPGDCRYDQLDVAAPYEILRVFEPERRSRAAGTPRRAAGSRAPRARS